MPAIPTGRKGLKHIDFRNKPDSAILLGLINKLGPNNDASGQNDADTGATNNTEASAIDFANVPGKPIVLCALVPSRFIVLRGQDDAAVGATNNTEASAIDDTDVPGEPIVLATPFPLRFVVPRGLEHQFRHNPNVAFHIQTSSIELASLVESMPDLPAQQPIPGCDLLPASKPPSFELPASELFYNERVIANSMEPYSSECIILDSIELPPSKPVVLDSMKTPPSRERTMIDLTADSTSDSQSESTTDSVPPIPFLFNPDFSGYE